MTSVAASLMLGVYLLFRYTAFGRRAPCHDREPPDGLGGRHQHAPACSCSPSASAAGLGGARPARSWRPSWASSPPWGVLYIGTGVHHRGGGWPPSSLLGTLSSASSARLHRGADLAPSRSSRSGRGGHCAPATVRDQHRGLRILRADRAADLRDRAPSAPAAGAVGILEGARSETSVLDRGAGCAPVAPAPCWRCRGHSSRNTANVLAVYMIYGILAPVAQPHLGLCGDHELRADGFSLRHPARTPTGAIGPSISSSATHQTPSGSPRRPAGRDAARPPVVGYFMFYGPDLRRVRLDHHHGADARPLRLRRVDGAVTSGSSAVARFGRLQTACSDRGESSQNIANFQIPPVTVWLPGNGGAVFRSRSTGRGAAGLLPRARP